MIYESYTRGRQVRMRISGVVETFVRLSDGAAFTLQSPDPAGVNPDGIGYMAVVNEGTPGIKHIVEGNEVILDCTLDLPLGIDSVESVTLVSAGPYPDNKGTWSHYIKWCEDNDFFPLDRTSMAEFAKLFPRVR